MALPSRFAPPTELDALRTLMAEFSERDASFQGQFIKALDTLRQLALPELGQRLAGTATPRGLREVILRAAVVYDWPEWDLHLMRMLQPEEDLDLFDQGCAALGALCTRRAMEGLQRLKELRHDPAMQELLDRELLRYQLNFAFEDSLAWLLEGNGNPVLARMGARALAGMEGAEHLDEWWAAFREGDVLTRHLALHVLAFHRDPDADVLLLHLFQEARDDTNDYRQLAALVERLEAAPKAARRELLLEAFEARFAALPKGPADPAGRQLPELEGCRAAARGPFDGFLVEAMDWVAAGKPGAPANLIRETATLIPVRLQQQAATLDDIAELAAFKVVEGTLALEETLPFLEQAFHLPAGGAGLLIAYLRLIPAEDRTRLDRVLAEPDLGRRVRCIEALGAREEDALVPFFLRALNSPVPEVSHTAVRQLGKLPSAFALMMDLFRSSHLDRVREAIQFFSENRTAAAAKPLQLFIASENPDELLVDAVNALGILADPSTANAMLAQLHSGKPLLLQIALVEALTRLQTSAASLGLLKKSEELTMPQVLLLALKGALAAFPSFENPFPLAEAANLEHLVERCCDSREGAGQWLNAALAIQDLFIFDQAVYERLREQFNLFLVDMHLRPSWDRKSHDLALEALRKLTRRAASLSKVEDRERALEKLLEAAAQDAGRRQDSLLGLQETLEDPELVLSPACAQHLVAFIQGELQGDIEDFHELELLCDIAGLSGQSVLIEPLRELFSRSAGAGRKSAARKALLALGLTDKEIDRRLPIKLILLLEPNAFFRKRALSVLEGPDRTIVQADSRRSAEALLEGNPVDLLIAESHDAEGELADWLEATWTRRACRYVLLSTSSHDIKALADKPWIIGRLFKPYPIEELQKVLEG
jgi:hypothetical protein